jgi:hypothetical protein
MILTYIIRCRCGFFYNLLEDEGSDPAIVIFSGAWAAWPFLDLLEDEHSTCAWELVPAQFTRPDPDIRFCLNPGRYSVGRYLTAAEVVEL